MPKEEQGIYYLLFEYREVFSLMYETGTCYNIEVDLQVTDKSPFFIKPFLYERRQISN